MAFQAILVTYLLLFDVVLFAPVRGSALRFRHLERLRLASFLNEFGDGVLLLCVGFLVINVFV